MSNLFTELSDQLANAVDSASRFVVQVHGHRRPGAGIVFDADLVVAPARAVNDEVAAVSRADGQTFEGQRARVRGVPRPRDHPRSGLGGSEVRPASELRVGTLAVAVGRTWPARVLFRNPLFSTVAVA